MFRNEIFWKMKNTKRERIVSEKTREIIDRRKSALLKLGKDDEEIQRASEKVFDRWDEAFTELSKPNKTDK